MCRGPASWLLRGIFHFAFPQAHDPTACCQGKWQATCDGSLSTAPGHSPSDSVEHVSRHCCEGSVTDQGPWPPVSVLCQRGSHLWSVRRLSFILWRPLIQSAQGLKSKSPKKEILPQDGTMHSCLSVQPADLPYSFLTHQSPITGTKSLK